jgi:hypothetical protein
MEHYVSVINKLLWLLSGRATLFVPQLYLQLLQFPGTPREHYGNISAWKVALFLNVK